MAIQLKDHREVELRRLVPGDLDNLFDYLQNLSQETKKKFGPHRFDRDSINEFHEYPDQNRGYIALWINTNIIVAYAVVKLSFLEHDSKRLQSFGLIPDQKTDCTFAPSVADQWQHFGLGKAMLNYVISNLISEGFQRMILWGGVQSDNEYARNYYLSAGFVIVGEFEYFGRNEDMILEFKK